MTLARELTKEHEEIWHGRLGEALARSQTQAPRGEYVIVIEGAPPAPAAESGAWPVAQVREALAILAQEGIDTQTAPRLLARLSGWRKKDVYRLLVTDRDAESDEHANP